MTTVFGLVRSQSRAAAASIKRQTHTGTIWHGWWKDSLVTHPLPPSLSFSLSHFLSPPHKRKHFPLSQTQNKPQIILPIFKNHVHTQTLFSFSFFLSFFLSFSLSLFHICRAHIIYYSMIHRRYVSHQLPSLSQKTKKELTSYLRPIYTDAFYAVSCWISGSKKHLLSYVIGYYTV